MRCRIISRVGGIPMGKFITLEGSDRSGKTTQARLLREYLSARGVAFVWVREPGGTELGEALRRLLLDATRAEMDPVAELFLFAAARAQLVRKVIRPALAEGQVVLVERYTDSTVAYQGYGSGTDLGVVDLVNQWATGGTLPDLTIVLDADPASLGGRRGEAASDRIEQRGLEFQRRVREGYRASAARDPERVSVIDAARDVMAIHRDIVARVETTLADSSQ
ncbi:MAG TPA: dTMP kinase [Bacillota bacterium]|nr:dTMP kinase [Bacillota bacterium]